MLCLESQWLRMHATGVAWEPAVIGNFFDVPVILLRAALPSHDSAALLPT